jgi:DNA-binding NtrC family response regulator
MHTLLVVEDDRAIQRSLVGFLGDLGYAVDTASDGREGLARLLAGGHAACLLDMGLPEMDGMAVLQRYKKEVGPGEQPPIIVVSARDDMASTVEAVRHGAYDYLLKPVDLDRLQLTLARAIEQRTTSRALAHMIAQDHETAGEMLGRSEPLRRVFKAVGAVASTRATVLIRGESGTGKELVARAIHRASSDPSAPFVAVNCTAFARELLESELFGHVKGAFTGAGSDKVGRFELAGSGTLLLDEVGELPLSLQVKLLRVIQERVFERVGDVRPQKLEARLVAATHRDLGKMVREGTFREDLYYRLRVVEIEVPPLRDRKGDLPLLVSGLLSRVNRALRTQVHSIHEEAMARLVAHDWPGNVRELENVLTGACVAAKGGAILPEHLSLGLEPAPAGLPAGLPADPLAPPGAPASAPLEALREIERQHVERVLVHTHWNKRQACAILKITRPTLDRKIKDFGLTRPA